MVEGSITSAEDIGALIQQAKTTKTSINIIVGFDKHDGVLLRAITPSSRVTSDGVKLHYSGRGGKGKDPELHSVNIGENTPYGTQIFTNYWMAHAYCLRRFGKGVAQMVDL